MADAVTILSLSKEEFLESVTGARPRVAVFDCDGTLWSGDAGSAFMEWTIETGLVSREVMDCDRCALPQVSAGRGFGAGDLRGDGADVPGSAGGEMRQAAQTFFAQAVEPNIFPEMAELVATLRADGTEIWAVSSTNDWVVEEGVKRFGIPAERVLAARVRVRGWGGDE